MRCILHIGLEKTGTTSIQHCLAKNRNQLRGLGVLYPACLGPTNHSRLAAYALTPEKLSVCQFDLGIRPLPSMEKFRSNVLRDLERELHTARYQTLLLSNEHLSSRLHTHDELGCLKSLLDRVCTSIMVMVYLRPQGEIYDASLSTAVKAGSVLPEYAFTRPDLNAGHTNLRYDYYALLERWGDVFGEENLLIRRLAPCGVCNGNVVDDFLDTLDLPLILDSRERRNKSLGRKRLAFLNRLNREIPAIKDNKVNPFRRHIVSALDRIDYPDARLRTRAAQLLDQHFEESNNAVALRYLDQAHLFPHGPRKEAEDSDMLLSEEDHCRLYAEVMRHVFVGNLIEADNANIVAGSKNLTAMIRIAKSYTVFCPDSDSLWAHIGRLCTYNNDAESAKQAYAEAIRLNPMDSKHRLQMSTIHFRLGEHAKAVESVGEAIRLENDNAYYYSYLAQYCHAAGDLDNAVANYTMALKLDPGNAMFRDSLRKIQQVSGPLN